MRENPFIVGLAKRLFGDFFQSMQSDQLLGLATAAMVAGGIWAIDAWVLRPARLREAGLSPDVPPPYQPRPTVTYVRQLLSVVITYLWARFLLSVSPETLLSAVLVTGGVVVLEAFSPTWLVGPRPTTDSADADSVASGLNEPTLVQYSRYLCLYLMLILLVQSAVYDFALALVASAVVTAVVWLVDSVFFRRKRMSALAALHSGKDGEREDLLSYEPLGVEYARSFFPIILLVLVVRSFLFEPFRIPSDSMVPTLVDGDFIFVNKYSYGLRLPVVNMKVVQTGEPSRGDVVVFRLPSEPTTNFIKRLIGLPGDRIRYQNKKLYINGELIATQLNGRPDRDGYLLGVERLGENEHQFRVHPSTGGVGYDGEVPQGHYFFMGDNRDNSKDSRFPEVGMVPEKNLVGKAVLIWMNWGDFFDRVGQIE